MVCKGAESHHPVSREQVERMRGEWINTNKEVEQMCKCSKCGIQ